MSRDEVIETLEENGRFLAAKVEFFRDIAAELFRALEEHKCPDVDIWGDRDPVTGRITWHGEPRETPPRPRLGVIHPDGAEDVEL